jgi:hypothetical protein
MPIVEYFDITIFDCPPKVLLLLLFSLGMSLVGVMHIYDHLVDHMAAIGPRASIATNKLTESVGLNGRYRCASCDCDWSHTEPCSLIDGGGTVRMPSRRPCSIMPRARVTPLPWPSLPSSSSSSTSVLAHDSKQSLLPSSSSGVEGSPVRVNESSIQLWNTIDDGTATIDSITLLFSSSSSHGGADANLRHPHTGRSILHHTLVEIPSISPSSSSWDNGISLSMELLRGGADPNYVSPCEGSFISLAIDRSQTPAELLLLMTTWLHHGGHAETVSLHDIFIKCWYGKGAWRELFTENCSEHWNWSPSVLSLFRLLVCTCHSLYQSIKSS